MRADAARNRARVLEVAYETFAADGLSVPIDEIARRAGVGAGTIYRHFPTKEALFQAVIAERIHGVVDEGRALLAEADPADALFMFLRSMVLQWGAADRGLVDALAGSGIDVNTVVPEAEDEYLGSPRGSAGRSAEGGHGPARRHGLGREGTAGRMSGHAGLQRRCGRAGHLGGVRRVAGERKAVTPWVCAE